VARRKKRNENEPAPPPPVPGEARTSLRALLKDVVVSATQKDAPIQKTKPQAKAKTPKTEPSKTEPSKGEPSKSAGPSAPPSETLRGDDRIAWHDAFAGVRPLGAKERARARVAVSPSAPIPSARDEEARARLAALVGGGVRFEIMRDGDEIRGRRRGSSDGVLRALMRKDARPAATLDLHGMRASEAEREVVRFLRAEQRRGIRRVLIVHGKGLHSEGGAVLSDVVVRVITEGGAAPVVNAFVTASHSMGGSGALLIELTP
jgi:DNA-nicking Smr family endonuclease